MPFDPQKFVSTVRPDEPDFRDRMYSPMLRNLPATLNHAPFDNKEWVKRVKDQGATMACTGYALSSMVEHLVFVRDAEWSKDISEHMLYYVARLYDEIPGEDSTVGSTARGAMKGWHRHGACRLKLWNDGKLDPNSAEKGWQGDAFKTPLGAYYRVDHMQLADMHAAINETGVIYVTSQIHTGWLEPENGRISFDGSQDLIGGHAFLLVGYDENGFVIQNSWGIEWGRKGFAHISYGDWQANGMDAWVGQLGVTISSVVDTISAGLDYSLYKVGRPAGASMLSSNANVSAQQINHYIIDMENNGKLSSSGTYWTTPPDIDKLLNVHLPNALAQWGMTNTNDPIDVALYAHGGLTPEAGAANTARFWLPELYANKIFPIFFMWETGLKDTLGNIVKDAVFGTAAAPRWWTELTDPDKIDSRMEGLLSKPGTLIWDQMKQNACAASMDLTDTSKAQSVDNVVVNAFQNLLTSSTGTNGVLTAQSKGALAYVKESLAAVPENIRKRLRLHLIGHSAGSIFHAYLLKHLLQGLVVDGIYFMAPACRVDLFDSEIRPFLENGSVRAYAQYQLVDRVERDDNCHPLPYNKSLLYLVSNSFERGQEVPILGMKKFSETVMANKPTKVKVWDFVDSPSAPGAHKLMSSLSTSHGGFDNDVATRDSIIARILSAVPAVGRP